MFEHHSIASGVVSLSEVTHSSSFHCFIIFFSSPVIKKMLIKDNPEETMKKRRSYDALDLKMETSKVTNVSLQN
jgi:hypothetical protein